MLAKPKSRGALSAAKDTKLIRLQCYEGLDAAQAIYEWNYQRQLLSIRAASEDGVTGKAVEDRIFSRDFLLERPLLAAITQEAPPVLLIDEIDRADEEFEAYLLEVLSDFQISIPELGTITATTRPIVILTSNGTRDLSDALRRRCLYTYVAYPERATELAILKARCPEVDVRLGEQIVGFVQKLRGEDLEKTPGIAEMLDGTILQGWLGGGCARGAVKRATLQALRDGKPQLVSVAPEDLLAKKGIAAGDTIDGTRFARNGCPSRGTVDIFIEPCLPAPQLVVLGASPVAQALSSFAPQFHWSVAATLAQKKPHQQQFVVVATQGQGDLDALKSALSEKKDHVAFVGSRRKYAALAEKLVAAGIDRSLIESVQAPAGLNLGAVTPEEIALSILAQFVQIRRMAVKPEPCVM